MESHLCLLRGLKELSKTSWKPRSALYDWCLLYSHCCQNKSLPHPPSAKEAHSYVFCSYRIFTCKKADTSRRNIQWFHTEPTDRERHGFSGDWENHEFTGWLYKAKTKNQTNPNQTKNRLAHCKKKKNVIKQLHPSIPTRQQPGPVWPACYAHCHIHEGADSTAPSFCPTKPSKRQPHQYDSRLHVEQAQPRQAQSKHSINLH